MTLYRIWLLEAESGQKVTGPERRGQSIWEAIHRAVDVRPRGIQGWGQWAGETWVGVGVVPAPPASSPDCLCGPLSAAHCLLPAPSWLLLSPVRLPKRPTWSHQTPLSNELSLPFPVL